MTGALDERVRRAVDESVLCWLATVSGDGRPNVSPKEVFAIFEESVVIANIASPRSAKNIREHGRACVGLLNVFTQKGVQVTGAASCLRAGDEGFDRAFAVLHAIAGDTFPFKEVMRVRVEDVREIVAPRYRLFPETTEEDQVADAMRTYGVRPAADRG